jgi:hypothetical protein
MGQIVSQSGGEAIREYANSTSDGDEGSRLAPQLGFVALCPATLRGINGQNSGSAKKLPESVGRGAHFRDLDLGVGGVTRELEEHLTV